MITVAVSELEWVQQRGALKPLNRIAASHNIWTQRLITGATGCERDEAMALLWRLTALGAAKPVLLVYHQRDQDETDPLPPILIRDFREGPPTLPFVCEICDREIVSEDELIYSVEFSLTESVQFV